jgi:hypothetical protein
VINFSWSCLKYFKRKLEYTDDYELNRNKNYESPNGVQNRGVLLYIVGRKRIHDT